ncbi:MAG: hypothetical protein N2561_09780 [Bacteroidetes bacterium]|nr:hypothetical protein [Rhodothermia bacterium]MCS7155220.1 hypothetical protein [Bacteroidota bacterium]MCX7907805.1 hypothetical protein [Bacteroidota bacterium]MDW8138624.1 hypothetical protein [Bacteroidota bacterium]MDW8284790.1 hypothetical protein [Bacteroidota bacterium]
MQALWDHAQGVVIGMIALLLLLGIQERAREARTEATLYVMARSELMAFVEMLEADLANIGSGVPAGEAKLLSGDSLHLEFRRRIEANGPIRTVRYVRLFSRYGPDGRPLYEVRRYLDGAPAGSGPSALRAFRFELLNDAGQPTTIASEVRQIRVYLAAAYPFDQQKGYLPHTRWQATYRPRALAQS